MKNDPLETGDGSDPVGPDGYNALRSGNRFTLFGLFNNETVGNGALPIY